MQKFTKKHSHILEYVDRNLPEVRSYTLVDDEKVKIMDRDGDNMTLTCDIYGDIIDVDTGQNLSRDETHIGFSNLSKKQLENIYRIMIVDDSYFNPFTNRIARAYKFYTADGSLWGKGFKTLAEVRRECEIYEEDILKTKYGVRKMGRYKEDSPGVASLKEETRKEQTEGLTFISPEKKAEMVREAIEKDLGIVDQNSDESLYDAFNRTAGTYTFYDLNDVRHDRSERDDHQEIYIADVTQTTKTVDGYGTDLGGPYDGTWKYEVEYHLEIGSEVKILEAHKVENEYLPDDTDYIGLNGNDKADKVSEKSVFQRSGETENERKYEVIFDNLPGNRTALKIPNGSTPYAIVTNYDPAAPEGRKWDSAYGYYKDVYQLARDLTDLDDVHIGYSRMREMAEELAEGFISSNPEEAKECIDYVVGLDRKEIKDLNISNINMISNELIQSEKEDRLSVADVF